MIKLVMCLRRRADLTRAEFLDYWQHRHAPFFQENAATLGAKKYVQCHTLDSPLNDGFRESRGMQPDYDGVAEVWFESEEALMQAMSSDDGEKLGAALAADESNFIDHARSSAFIVREIDF